MNPLGWPPTLWALAAAFAFVAAARPRPRVRRPGGLDLSQRPATTRSTRSTRRRAAAGDEHDATALAAWCEAVARAARSGASLPTALDEVGGDAIAGLTPAAAATLAAVGQSIRRGAPLPTPSTDADLGLVVGVLRSCIEHGGAAAEPLDRAAAVLRGRAAQAAERRSQSTQARLSAQVMTLLPAAMLMLLVTTSASVRTAVVTPAGGLAVVTGAALNLAGWRWQRRIIRRSAA